GEEACASEREEQRHAPAEEARVGEQRKPAVEEHERQQQRDQRRREIVGEDQERLRDPRQQPARAALPPERAAARVVEQGRCSAQRHGGTARRMPERLIWRSASDTRNSTVRRRRRRSWRVASYPPG